MRAQARTKGPAFIARGGKLDPIDTQTAELLIVVQDVANMRVAAVGEEQKLVGIKKCQPINPV